MTARPAGGGRVRRAGDWLAWLGGADREVLRDVPSARDRFVQMALVLLTTASLAIVSMTFALTNALNVDFVPVALFGVMWGFVILNIDRFLVINMGASRSLGHLTLMALPRLAMAVVLAAVISTPLVLQVFQSDIKAELSRYQTEQSTQQAALEPNTAEQKRLDVVNKQISGYESTLHGQLGGVTRPELDAAKQKVTGLEGDVTKARNEAAKALYRYQCELYGSSCHGGSKRRGAGPLAGAKRLEYNSAKSRLDSLETQLVAAKREVGRQQTLATADKDDLLAAAKVEANAKLPALRQERDQLAARIANLANDRSDTNSKDDGILAQLRALGRVGDQNSALRIAHLLVAALFFLIEILPVVVKILMNLGSPSAYDLAAGLKDEELRDRVTIHRIEARQVEEDKSQTRVGLEKNMRGHERKIGEEANERVARQMSTIVEAALEEWAEKVHADLASHASGNGHGPAGQSGNGNGATNGSAGPNGNGASGNGKPSWRRRFARSGHGGPPDPHGTVNNGYAMPPTNNL